MKRITLFLGHYGSGKSNLAANYAFYLRGKGLAVSVADLDIVNPYYRTKDWADEFAAAGIELVALPFANTNLDLPALPSEIYGLLQRRDRSAVFDIGGDDRGAYALGRFTPYILAEQDYDAFFVVNFLRPLTATPEEALESLREIEAAAGLPFTGIVGNTNLGRETTEEHVLKGLRLSLALSELSGLPLVFTAADRSLRLPEGDYGREGLFPVRIKHVL